MTTTFPPGFLRKPRLLLVDDVPANLHVLVNLLADTFELQFATHGKEALALLEKSPQPDLILLDIMMPGLDGYAVCRELKRRPETQDIPVIFVSALDEAADEVLAFEVGGADYITKPFDADVVLARIRHQVRVKFSFDALRAQPGSLPLPDSDNVFRQAGSAWEIGYRGQPRLQMKDMLGLAYLQRLLAHPGHYFSVEEIVFLTVPRERDALFARAATTLGEEALAHYQRLAGEILGNRQAALLAAANPELAPGSPAWLLTELRRAGVLGPDAALALEERERYRKSVGNAIRRAIRELGEQDQALANHLQYPNLRLGYELVYAPRERLVWLV